MSSSLPITVLLADDHPIVLYGFSTALRENGFDIVGSVENSSEIESRFFSLNPTILILDIQFGANKMNGLDVAKSILGKEPNAKIIFLSMIEDVVLIKKTYSFGAMAYVLKDCSVAELSNVIRCVAEKGVYYPPSVAQMLADYSIHGLNIEQKLDERELHVFKLLANGMSAQDISGELRISLRTVSDLTSSVKKKLNIQKNVELTLLAVQLGIIQVRNVH